MNFPKSLMCALAVLLGWGGSAIANEAYLDQALRPSDSPAFLDQLPETALERPATTKQRTTVQRRKRNAANKVPPVASRKSSQPRSVFPSVERGATAAFPPPTAGLHFPTVGAGTVGK